MREKMKWRTVLMVCMLAFLALLLSACDNKGRDSSSKITAYRYETQDPLCRTGWKPDLWLDLCSAECWKENAGSRLFSWIWW